MDTAYRKTKIIFTVGPATTEESILEQMICEGVDICRINMAHTSHEETRKVVEQVHRACQKVGRQIALLMDVKGPEIRTGEVPETFPLEKGNRLDFTYGVGIGETGADGVFRVDVNYPGLMQDIHKGDTVLVDNGLIQLKVLEIDESRVRTEVVIPGPLSNRRHINLPGARVNLPALTEKDKNDIDVGIEAGIDFFALSFVREATDLKLLSNYLEERGSRAKIIAKIEDQQAISNLESIIKASDGLMVARGDLGIECPFEDLPSIQSDAVAKCIQNTKPVIVATHMLESMIDSPIPTRAEVTDIANAIREQADCVMLSGETAVGKYPVECIRTINRIAHRIEMEQRNSLREDVKLELPRSMMLKAAATLSVEMNARAILVFTRRGIFSQKLSSLRPRVPIYAFTDNEALFRQMLIMRGIEPFFMKFDHDHEVTIQSAFSMLKELSWCEKGNPIVVVTKVYAGKELIHSTQIREID